MPAVAAHALFGQAVFAQLPTSIQLHLSAQSPYWTLGLQGPDLLFYHKPLSKSLIAAHGSALHNQNPVAFFQSAPWDDPRQVTYLLGFACHYCLDRGCHPVVNQAAGFQSTPHRLIESAFDLHLLTKANLPLKRQEFIPKLSTYAPIAMAYGLPSFTVKQCGHSFCRYTKLLDHPKLVKLANQPSFSALCLPKEPDYLNTCLQLDALFQQTIPTAVTLVTKLYQWAEEGHPFPCCLRENFEGVIPQ